MAVDLHLHTKSSDGTLSPTQLVKEAKKLGLKGLAITDHDSVGGVDEALREGKKAGIEVIPGIEISVDDKKLKLREVHVVGLFVNHKDKSLKNFLSKLRKAREVQKRKMVQKLQKLGYKISFSEVKKLAGESIGRPHIAQALLKNHPELKNIQNIFDTLLGVGKKAYVERQYKTTLKKAIDVINSARGMPILAHPAVYSGVNKELLVKKFKELGGVGIETIYPYHKSSPYTGITKTELNKIIKKYKNFCRKYNLCESGGSDFHGFGKDVKIGELRTPDTILKTLKKNTKKQKF